MAFQSSLILSLFFLANLLDLCELIMASTNSFERKSCPAGFLFGSSVPDYGFAAAEEDGKCHSMWDTYTHQHLERISEDNNDNIAPESYHRGKDNYNPKVKRSDEVEIEQLITFSNYESTQLEGSHHDALVITLLIANRQVNKILIDSGSSANVLMLHAFKEMGIDESNITRFPTLLVGFSGEQKYTIGEIVLPTYAEGVNLSVKYLVVDSRSAYNVILGRSWIHDMKAVPSTYHQVIKFPTEWGVREIKGQRKVSRDCYHATLKKVHPSVAFNIAGGSARSPPSVPNTK